MGLIRDVPPEMMAAIRRPGFCPVAFVYLDWPDEPVRAHSSVGQIVIAGQIWHGVGAFGAIDVPAETGGLVAARSGLTLLGVPPATLERLEDPVRDRDGEIHFGVATKAGGNQLVSPPISMFTGYVDAMSYQMQLEDGTLKHAVQIELGSGPSARSAASVVHSPEDQKRRHPEDTCGRHLIGIEAVTGTMSWPEK